MTALSIGESVRMTAGVSNDWIIHDGIARNCQIINYRLYVRARVIACGTFPPVAPLSCPTHE
jgi:hypothetical protein